MLSILGANTLSSDDGVANSCRFNSGSQDYLDRTPSSAGNQKKFTFSTWIKRGKIAGGSGGEEFIMYGRPGTNTDTRLYFTGDGNANDDRLVFQSTTSNTSHTTLQTNRKFRDTSAWYNIVISANTEDGNGSSSTIKMFINGVQETSFATENYGSQNALFYWTDDALTTIGRRSENNGQHLNAYLAEVVLIDGQALDADSFGEFDENTPTIWKPISVSGLSSSKGTNGFYLDFKTSDTLGNDAFGGTDFSNNNLTATDQSTDTCTNNFATMNPLAKGPDITISEGNLKVSNGNSDNSILGTIGFGGGKWYWEAKCTGATTYANIGVTLASADGTTHSTVDAGRVVYSHNGYVYKEGLSGQGNVSGLATFTTNDIVSVAYDGENGSVKFYKNGTLVNTTTDSDLEFSTNEYITSIGINQGGFELNFGSPPYSISSGNADANGHGNFEYAVPSGYFALCTKNLAEHG